MWLHVFRDFVMVFLVLSATLLDFHMSIFFSWWFWFFIFSVDFYIFKCFSTIFFDIFKHESHHLLIVIILVQFFVLMNLSVSKMVLYHWKCFVNMICHSNECKMLASIWTFFKCYHFIYYWLSFTIITKKVCDVILILVPCWNVL